jgi:predicted DNA-binding transcriptional regulator YafY
VSKILLESRAFTKQEMGDILDKLIGGCVPDKNKKTVSDLLANEKYHYVELKHKQEFQDILWDFGEDIKKLRRVEISYRRLQEKDHSASQDSSESMEKHYIIEPVGLLFSEYYFYLNAFIVEQNKRGDWKHKYRYPAIFRLDRVISRKDTGETFQVSYKDRFEEGLFRKRTQFMYAGDLLRLKFRYFGYSVDAVLDRLPTAHIVKQEKDSCVIEAEVYGNGIVMWLLSQGSNVEVLKPLTLRNDIKKLLRAMLEQYE